MNDYVITSSLYVASGLKYGERYTCILSGQGATASLPNVDYLMHQFAISGVSESLLFLLARYVSFSMCIVQWTIDIIC